MTWPPFMTQHSAPVVVAVASASAGVRPAFTNHSRFRTTKARPAGRVLKP